MWIPCNVLKNIEWVSLIARLSNKTRVDPPAFALANTKNRQNNLFTSFIANHPLLPSCLDTRWFIQVTCSKHEQRGTWERPSRPFSWDRFTSPYTSGTNVHFFDGWYYVSHFTYPFCDTDDKSTYRKWTWCVFVLHSLSIEGMHFLQNICNIDTEINCWCTKKQINVIYSLLLH